MYTNARTQAYACVYVHTHAHIHIMYMYFYMYIYLYVYNYILNERIFLDCKIFFATIFIIIFMHETNSSNNICFSGQI